MNEETAPQPPRLFRQYRAIITPKAVILVLFWMGAAFLSVGIVLTVSFQDLVKIEVRYDTICKEYFNSSELCPVQVNITDDINATIYLHYRLKTFYQTYRRYYDSKSTEQLGGEYLDYNGLESCAPMISKDGNTSEAALYLPCGLMPMSFFNDTYSFYYPEIANFSETGIAWQNDIDNVFKPISENYTSGIRWLDDMTKFVGGTTNEHFIVWMRTAAFPDFKKLYAHCDNCTLPAGSYTFYIDMSYPKSLYHGERWIVLSTTAELGGESWFMSIAYIAIGGTSLIISMSFLIHTIYCPRKLGDMTRFSQS